MYYNNIKLFSFYDSNIKVMLQELKEYVLPLIQIVI